MASNGGSTVYRNVPDVAMVAKNVYTRWTNGAETDKDEWGTSTATPLWAAVCALANQQAAAQGNAPVGFANPALYAAGKGCCYSNTFHDIADGSNNHIQCNKGIDVGPFYAVAGYDLCAGWGTPAGWNTIHALAPTCLTVPPGLIAWWRGESNANDNTGYHNGTSEGSVTYATGRVGSAFYLQGNCDVVVPAGPNGVGSGASFTVEGWINASDTIGRPVVEWDSPSLGLYGVHLWANFPSAGTLFANVKDSTGADHTFQSTPGLFGTGSFQHVALTYDQNSGTATLYLNGFLVGQSQIGSISPQMTYNVYLGARVVSGGGHWFGLLDEISFYNVALSGDQIYLIYQAGAVGKCSN
jgi:hypothetical protein